MSSMMMHVLKMKKIVLTVGTLTLLLTLVLALVSCDTTATTGGEPADTLATSVLQTDVASSASGISVVGTGVASAPPDVALVDVGVEVINTDANLAFSENATRMAAVMNVLNELEIKEEDVQTVNFNMWIEPVYDRRGEPTGENRYHVIHQVRVQLRDLTATGALLQKALEAGANNFGGISFGVDNTTALQNEARDIALADAKAKAEQLATSLGVKLGAPRQVSELEGQPAPFGGAKMADGIGGGGPVPVTAGEFGVTVNVQLVYGIVE